MNQVLEWLDDIGFPTVRQEAEIADCLSKAELYKHHFESGFLSVAQVSQCVLIYWNQRLFSTQVDMKLMLKMFCIICIWAAEFIDSECSLQKGDFKNVIVLSNQTLYYILISVVLSYKNVLY